MILWRGYLISARANAMSQLYLCSAGELPEARIKNGDSADLGYYSSISFFRLFSSSLWHA
jgi:hypothetical protein